MKTNFIFDDLNCIIYHEGNASESNDPKVIRQIIKLKGYKIKNTSLIRALGNKDSIIKALTKNDKIKENLYQLSIKNKRLTIIDDYQKYRVIVVLDQNGSGFEKNVFDYINNEECNKKGVDIFEFVPDLETNLGTSKSELKGNSKMREQLVKVAYNNDENIKKLVDLIFNKVE